jgi:S-DNA-T family DNA segregation ATPase FtsK/SpoIIIE
MNTIPTESSSRLKEFSGVVCLAISFSVLFALASFDPLDPAWNTATGRHPASNKIGLVGAFASDLLFQSFGLAAWLLPVLLLWVGIRWLRHRTLTSPLVRITGYGLLILSAAAALELARAGSLLETSFAAGGLFGFLFTSSLESVLNTAGTAIFLAVLGVLSVYLISSFSVERLASAIEPRLAGWLPRWRRKPADAASGLEARAPEPEPPRRAAAAAAGAAVAVSPGGLTADLQAAEDLLERYSPPPIVEQPPAPPAPDVVDDIPIRPLEEPEPAPAAKQKRSAKEDAVRRAFFKLPPTRLLNPPPEREGYDSEELKEIAGRIRSKLEEFNVFGNVVQINPGPVVTTFEFKPDAGVKISKITTLSEDLCLGLQAESILIERIPGKPTVGIEVPNTRRETISLRQILESDDFIDSPHRLTFALGKDITGRIRVTELERMPHLLIAGSTGSGKSVMLNTLIMSVLYKSTPDEVRMILIDPKRVELGIYDGIPHLLTPVIIEPKKAVNALRNAVFEMERRLKLLASYGVRNIEQFNKRIRELNERPLSLFDEQQGAEAAEPERPLPYILIVIDELADLMMLERAGVEESVIRLAQMARAVGMHLVLATQRPSVDVITGLIKANFPARISFRVATRVDSRTVLDVMGAEHLLGKGDMLFLPPGSSRLVRIHGAFVTESEITEVVDFWRKQAQPDYDQSYLLAPPTGDEEEAEDDADGYDDPLYVEAVRILCQVGKASTSILQRRLRIGYGRAARLLDRMEKEKIIGPPDGARPRDILRRPDWLDSGGDEDAPGMTPVR